MLEGHGPRRIAGDDAGSFARWDGRMLFGSRARPPCPPATQASMVASMKVFPIPTTHEVLEHAPGTTARRHRGALRRDGLLLGPAHLLESSPAPAS